MTPEVWLRSTQMVKVRNKLPTWSRQDILNLSLEHFGKVDLSKVELAGLLGILRNPKCTKPVLTRELSIVSLEQNNEEVVEFKLNKKVTSDCTEWYWASGRFGLRFKDASAATEWALGLILKDQTRANWNKLQNEWNSLANLKTFTPELFPKAELKGEAKRVLTKKLNEDVKLRTPLPDNSTIRKRYWSLSEGDTLSKVEGHRMVKATVVQTRINMDGPPTVVVEVEDGSEAM